MKENLEGLIIYRNLLQDPIIADIHKGNLNKADFKAKVIELAESKGLSGNVLKQHIFKLVTQDDNIFTHMADKGLPIGESLCQAVAEDVRQILNFIEDLRATTMHDPIFSDYQPSMEKQDNSIAELLRIMILQTNNPRATTEALAGYYKTNSFGIMANYNAFVWREDRGLVGVESKHPETFDSLVGYEYQKNILKENTRAFLNDLPANNVLLYGDRGTGKSSSIKALIPEYAAQGLRLVEISKTDFVQMPEIMAILSKYGRKFILILDDLSFERFEIEYKQLKSYMDGALEQKPSNVLIYATSNRRNIINETWEEQQGEEIHVRDSINERTSLVDRFGLKIYYESPGQEEYFKIVQALAKENNLDIPADVLRKEANKWQMSSSGRSGRVARNFIHHLMGNQKNIIL